MYKLTSAAMPLGVVLTVVLISTSHGIKHANNNNDQRNVHRDFVELTPWEKLVLQLAHPEVVDKIHRQSSGQVNQTIPSLSDYIISDLYQIDFPIIFLQLAALGESITLPNIYTDFYFYFCFEGCVEIIYIWDIRNTTINTPGLSLNTSLNGTRFQLKFHAPEIQINAPDLVYNQTSNNRFISRRGMEFMVRNLSLQFSADLQLGPEGLQFRNMEYFLEVTEIMFRIAGGSVIEPGEEEETDFGPEEYDLTPTFREAWEAHQEKMKPFEETWLNCFLSNGLNSIVGCEEYLTNRYHRLRFAQLLHAIGLGGLISNGSNLGLEQILNGFHQPYLGTGHGGLKNHPIGPTSSNHHPGKTISHEEYFPLLNTLIFQLSTAVLGIGKLFSEAKEDRPGKYPIMMPFTWTFTREHCDEAGECDEYHYQYHMGGTVEDELWQGTTWLEGGGKNDVELHFGSNSFSYRFTVPDLKLNSTDFRRFGTIFGKGYQLVHTGLLMAISNSTLGLKFDYEFGNGRFSVSNLDLTLELGAATLQVPRVALKEDGRDWRDLEALEMDAAPLMMELIKEKDESGKTLEERYEAFLEERINQCLIIA